MCSSMFFILLYLIMSMKQLHPQTLSPFPSVHSRHVFMSLAESIYKESAVRSFVMYLIYVSSIYMQVTHDNN